MKQKEIILTMNKEDLMPILTKCKENDLTHLDLRYVLSDDTLYHLYKHYSLNVDLKDCNIMLEPKFKSPNQSFFNLMFCIKELEQLMMFNEVYVRTIRFEPNDELFSKMKKIARDRKINDILKYNPTSLHNKRKHLVDIKIKNKKMSEIKRLDKQRSQQKRDLAIAEKGVTELNYIVRIIDDMDDYLYNTLCENKQWINPSNTILHCYNYGYITDSKPLEYNYCFELLPIYKGNKTLAINKINESISYFVNCYKIAKAMIEALTLQIDNIVDDINKKGV